jgi:hypothetical protein
VALILTGAALPRCDKSYFPELRLLAAEIAQSSVLQYPGVNNHDLKERDGSKYQTLGSTTKQTANQPDHDANLCRCHSVARVAVETVESPKGASPRPENKHD